METERKNLAEQVANDNIGSTKTETITVSYNNQVYTVDQDDVLWFLNFLDVAQEELVAAFDRGRVRRRRETILTVSLTAISCALIGYAIHKYLLRKSRKKSK